MRKAKSIRKQIQQIVVQGNQSEIGNLFREIYNACGEEFREDNRPSLDSFLIDLLMDASGEYWKRIMRESSQAIRAIAQTQTRSE